MNIMSGTTLVRMVHHVWYSILNRNPLLISASRHRTLALAPFLTAREPNDAGRTTPYERESSMPSSCAS